MPRKPSTATPTTVSTRRKRSSKPLSRPEIKLDELQALEENATRLERLANALLETPKQAFYVFSYAEGRFLMGQQQVSALCGYGAGEIEKIKDGWFGIIDSDFCEGFRELHERMMAAETDEVFAAQIRIRTKSGRHEWVDVRRRVFERDEAGMVLSEVGMVVLITGQKEAEEALNATQAACHALFRSNTAGVLSFDGAFRVLDANPMVCSMLRQDRAALLRMEVSDLVAPGNRAAIERMMSSLQSGKKPPASFETCLESSDGKRLEVLAAITCQRGADKRIERGMVIFTDLTARKEAEEGWRRELELKNVLIDHAPVAIGLLDAGATLLRVNRAAEELFGFKSKEVVGKQLWDIPVLDHDEVGPSKKRFMALQQGAKQVDAEIPMRTKEGEHRIVSTVTTAVRKPDGEIDFLVTTGIDVTERKRLEAEVIRVAEQEHIRIGADLHDGVGQTLTGVAALLEALVQRLDGEAKSDAERVHELIKTAQEETRRLSHGLSPAAVRNRGLVGGLRLVAETVRMNFRRECECHLDETITTSGPEADTHLFRIAQEAVNNAIRHGGARHIRLALRRHNDSLAVLEVADDGKGLESAKKSKKGGNPGIGMRVMEYRANLLGGELKVYSQAGKGVRVSCYFPTHMTKKRRLTILSESTF